MCQAPLDTADVYYLVQPSGNPCEVRWWVASPVTGEDKGSGGAGIRPGPAA